MSDNFPTGTGKTVTLATRYASQRTQFFDPDLGIHRIGQRSVAVEFSNFDVMSHHSTSLRRHYGPAICYERTDFDINKHREGAPAHTMPLSTVDYWGSHER